MSNFYLIFKEFVKSKPTLARDETWTFDEAISAAPEPGAMLAEIYNWFTEGFDTHYLKEAKALLDELPA